MPQKTLFFVHVPKAAGSTMQFVLDWKHPAWKTFNITGPYDINRFKHLPDRRRNGKLLVKGHFPYGLHEWIDGPATYFTVLRHPVDRIKSHYYWSKGRARHYLHSTIHRENLSLEQYVTTGISTEMNNGHLRLILGIDTDLPFGECSESMLDEAKAIIEKDFPVVGIAEQFDETLILLQEIMGWKTPPYYLIKNTNTKRPVTSRAGNESSEAILKFNRLDMELYQWASQRLEAQIAGRGQTFQGKLHQFREANARFQKWGAAPNIALKIKRRLKIPYNWDELTRF